MLKVKWWSIIEGPLNEVQGGDCGPICVFDTLVVAKTDKGLFANLDETISGFGGRDEDGFAIPNYHYKEEALALLEKHKNTTEVNESQWQLVPALPSLEESLAAEAEIENAERHGVNAPGFPYYLYNFASYAPRSKEQIDEEVRSFIAERRKQVQCHDDSCDLSHCAKCGCHMLGCYLEPGTVCESCRMGIDQILNRHE